MVGVVVDGSEVCEDERLDEYRLVSTGVRVTESSFRELNGSKYLVITTQTETARHDALLPTSAQQLSNSEDKFFNATCNGQT